jgi:hypothetical protein
MATKPKDDQSAKPLSKKEKSANAKSKDRMKEPKVASKKAPAKAKC